jgi:hypothetical protein
MAGFFRKVAGAFVYLDEPAQKAVDPGASLDDVARETGDLIAQLGGSQGDQSAQVPGAPLASASPMEMTASQVFAAAGLAEGSNSAQRLLKVIAGLSMFPRDQQLVMVRAMDAADETWSEAEVLEDARRRQAVLQGHLQSLEAERAGRLQWIADRAAKAEADGRQTLSDVDQRMQELGRIRQEALSATTSALQQLELERRQAEEMTETARRGITAVSNALSDLITFFGGARSREAGS